MAIPSRVVTLNGLSAEVECFGVRREVNLLLLGDDISIGDYLLIQAGGFAYEKVDLDRALESLALIEQVVTSSQPADDAIAAEGILAAAETGR